MSAISKELAALDAIMEGAEALMKEALERKADLKQGKLASETMGRFNAAIKLSINSRLNEGRLVEVEAKLRQSGRTAGRETHLPEGASTAGNTMTAQ